jgi:hypothetical protein
MVELGVAVSPVKAHAIADRPVASTAMRSSVHASVSYLVRESTISWASSSAPCRGVIQHPPAEQKTSTQEIRAVLDELIGHNKS